MRQLCAGLAVALVLALGASRAVSKDTVPTFTPVTGHLEHTAGGWQVWSVRDEFGNPSRRAIPFRTRYFRQRLGADHAELAFTMRGTHARRVATVLGDGTLVLHYFTEVLWAFPDGTHKSERPLIGKDSVRVLRGDPDGLLVQPYLLNTTAPVCFVPITGRVLRLGARLRIAKGNTPVNMPPDFVRGGNKLAWRREVFDLKTRTRRALPAGNTPTACDGETLVLWDYAAPDYVLRAFDLKKHEEPVTIPLRRNDGDKPVFTVRNRIGYFVSYGRRGPAATGAVTLHAIDLRSSDRRTKELLVIPDQPRRTTLSQRLPPVPHYETKDGLVLWIDGAWRTQKWLDAWPE